MKRCPECRRDYYDDSLLYCLDDGTALLDGPSSLSNDEPRTAILNDTSLPNEAAIKAQIHTTNIPGPDDAVSRGSIKFPTKLAAVVAAVVLIAAAGFIGIRYFRSD